MNTTRLQILALLAVPFAGTPLTAQDAAPASPAATAAPKTEMQKWIETTDAQWQAAFKKGVTDVHETELNKAKVQYIAALEDGIKKASAANDLKGALALRDEQKRFGDTQHFPEQDEAADPAAVKQIRAVIRAQIAKVNADHAARAKGLLAKYDALLAHAQSQLTQRERLDDAVLVQAKRDEVRGAWLMAPGAAPVGAVAQPKAPAAASIADVVRHPIPATQPKLEGTAEPVAITTPRGEALSVTPEIRAWNDPKSVAAGVTVFHGPNGPGRERRGARGVLVKADPVSRNGSAWAFRYQREKNALGMQIIHAHGEGQVIVNLRMDGVGIAAPKAWSEIGYGFGDAKLLVKSREYDAVFPLRDGEAHQVMSKLDGQGKYELSINGKIVATAQVTTASALSLVNSGFQEKEIPLKWNAGYSALIVSGVEDGNGSNACRDVLFFGSAAK